MLPVTKSAFAALIGRSPGRISQFIAEGKLTAPALRADGKIDPLLGAKQLRVVLDPSQQLGLVDQPPLLDDEPDEKKEPGKVSDQNRYLKLKADERELDVEVKRRRMAADSGRWMETAPAARDFARDLATIFTDLEAWVMTCGQDLADALAVDPRTATLTVKKSLHKFRAGQAEKRRAEGEALPELIEEPREAAE